MLHTISCDKMNIEVDSLLTKNYCQAILLENKEEIF